ASRRKALQRRPHRGNQVVHRQHGLHVVLGEQAETDHGPFRPAGGAFSWTTTSSPGSSSRVSTLRPTEAALRPVLRRRTVASGSSALSEKPPAILIASSVVSPGFHATLPACLTAPVTETTGAGRAAGCAISVAMKSSTPIMASVLRL